MPARNAERGIVLIVDDDSAVRDGLSMLMDAAGLASHSFASGPELLAWTPPPDEPACLLLDLRMPGMDGLEVQQALQARGSELPIVFLTAHGEVPTAVQAVQNGALGFLEKPSFDRQELLDLVRQGIAEHHEALQRREQNERIHERIARLTRRELEVARLVAGGLANKVIAVDLGISERTVEVHRGRAMKKLELRQLADLVRLERMLGKT
ncbi:MAG: response regulator transcription factor [Gammaproteobacteria bacterium]|nr:response regulator transcription factor [Gammaproteobacteria bacterium]